MLNYQSKAQIDFSLQNIFYRYIFKIRFLSKFLNDKFNHREYAGAKDIVD